METIEMELHRRKAQQTKKWRQRREELGSRETVAGESASAAGRGKLKLGCGGGGETHTHTYVLIVVVVVILTCHVRMVASSRRRRQCIVATSIITQQKNQ